jgi:DNA polymerase I-like protein with 3'-5' exonuclease and polymerase domains
MLRLAIILATQQSIEICAPVHDALLVESPVDAIGEVVAKTQAQMAQASELVLPGFPLRTDAKIIRCPERYFDDRGRRM